jgi:hypothetical protein
MVRSSPAWGLRAATARRGEGSCQRSRRAAWVTRATSTTRAVVRRVGDLGEGEVGGDQRDAEAVAAQHHDGVCAKALAEDLGVADGGEVGVEEEGLVPGGGADGGGAVRGGVVDGGFEGGELEGGVGGDVAAIGGAARGEEVGAVGVGEGVGEVDEARDAGVWGGVVPGVLGIGERGAGGVIEGAGEGEVGVAALEVVEDELEGVEGAVEPGVRGGVWVCEEL